MENFILFGIKNLIFTGLLWICFRVFISRNTFHQTNRLVILLIFIGGLLFPLIEIPLLKFNEENQTSISYFWKFDSTLTVESAEIQAINIENGQRLQNLTFGIYVVGTLFFAFRYAVGLISVKRIIRKARKINILDKKQIYVTSQNVSPFSWFNYVVLPEKDIQTDFQNIVNHEMAHVQYRHSWDLLFAELYCLVFWWNPFVWLLKKQLATVHEFQADERALHQTNDKNSYRKELIIRCVGAKKVALAHNFETSNLKKRIYMTMKNKSTANAKWSYATLILATVGTMFIFSTETLQAQEKKEISKKEKSDIKVIGQKADDDAKVIILEGNPNNETIKQETNSKFEDVLVIVDEKKSNMSKLNEINPQNIDHISVFKGKEGEEIAKKYGEYAKKEVIVVKTKSNVSVVSSELKGDIQKMDSMENALVILDGKEIEYGKLNEIAPQNIESVSVLKGEKATALYGEKGKNGVIIVVTKQKK